MPAIVTSQVVAEFYRDVDFPDDWTNKPTFITAGMARERAFSAIILLDANTQPLAACWQVADRDERFVRIRFDEGAEDDLLDAFDDDLREQSSMTGACDLFATLLWEPDSLRSDQGIRLHLDETAPFGMPTQWGWNVAPREIVSRASDLLIVIREITTSLSLAVPANAEAMHKEVIGGNSDKLIVLPASASRNGRAG